MLAFLDNLAVCAAASKASFVAKYNACYASAGSLSEACRVSVFGSVVPGGDGGMPDAGPLGDAGRQPIAEDAGGSALDFVAVADETGFAFAWAARQPASVAQWELNVFDLSGDGGRLPEQYLTPGSKRSYEQAAAAGIARRYY